MSQIINISILELTKGSHDNSSGSHEAKATTERRKMSFCDFFFLHLSNIFANS